MPAMGAAPSYRVQFKDPRQTGTSAAEMIRRYNQNPRTRAVASRLLNGYGDRVLQTLRDIAAVEFHEERDEERRPPESRAHGKHYVDSFVRTQATEDRIGRMTVVLDNTHPAKNLIENGAPPHVMPQKEGGFLSGPNPNAGDVYAFPWEGPDHAIAAFGSKGDWPANYDGDNAFATPGPINHPGHIAFNVFRRASAMYHRRNTRR